ncbi:MAG TPA: hypothetical protein VMT64_07985, partial [Candidatus Binataceae bacterium]|nr:hypothetical protein [Candidatus Binataceae bacterium]
MNLGVVTPQLEHYGGSEIYLLECLRRWQHDLDITLYTPICRRRLLDEFEVGPRVRVVKLPGGRVGRDAFFYNTIVLPRVWEQLIHPHDLYFLYLFPTHFIQRRHASPPSRCAFCMICAASITAPSRSASICIRR